MLHSRLQLPFSPFSCKGGSTYSSVSGFDCEKSQVDLYYFFKGSSRRKGILTKFLDFTGLEWEKFVKYVKTQWLPLEQCCSKEIKKFPALKSMFLSRVEKEVIDRVIFGQTDASGRKHSTKFKRPKDAIGLFNNRGTPVFLCICFIDIHQLQSVSSKRWSTCT